MSDGRDLEVVVHELRSPVAAIAAIDEAVRVGEHSLAERRALLDVAIRACADLERLVADASLFSLCAEDVEMEVVAQDVVASTVSRDGIAVRFVALGPIPPVRGDAVRLRQVVANLVANAVAHAPPGSEVVVAVEHRRDDDEVEVAVADDGEGIEPEHVSTIFDRGARLAQGRPGSGIGLYVSAAIAEAHGGRIDVASTPGRGARFTLVLPCSRVRGG